MREHDAGSLMRQFADSRIPVECAGAICEIDNPANFVPARFMNTAALIHRLRFGRFEGCA